MSTPEPSTSVGDGSTERPRATSARQHGVHEDIGAARSGQRSGGEHLGDSRNHLQPRFVLGAAGHALRGDVRRGRSVPQSSSGPVPSAVMVYAG